MHIHAHHVAQSVGQEEGVGAGADGFLSVALHESERLEPVGHEAAYIHVHIPPAHARPGVCQGEVVAVDDDVVYVPLALRVAAVHRCGARMVRTIVLARLGTGVAEQEPSGLERAGRGISVEYFAVHRHDALKRGDRAQ